MKVINVKYTKQDFYKKATNLILIRNTVIYFFKNGNRHRENGPTVKFPDGGKDWWFKGCYYGTDEDFTNKSWKSFVKNLKREERLNVFK